MNRILITLFFLLHVSAVAQEETSDDKILLRFTSFGVKDNGAEYIVAAADAVDGRTTAFKIPNNGFSVPIAAPTKGKTFALGRADSEPFQSLAAIKLPDVGKRFLVLVFPFKEKELRAVVIRADDPAFRPGQVMIMNLGQEALAGELGSEKLRFAPSSKTIFRPKRKDDLANYQVRFFMIKNGKPKVFAANLWPYFEGKRAFVFLFKDPITGSPTYRSIDEFTDWLD